MCMHWLKYIRLDRKDWLNKMPGMTLEVAMLANVSKAHSAIFSCLPMFDWASLTFVSLRYSLWMYVTLIVRDNNGAALESVVDYE